MFILFHNQYLLLSFKCLSDIDNIKVQHLIEICINQNVYLSFVHLHCIYSRQEIAVDSAAKPFLGWLTRLDHGGFLKNWINYEHNVLYLFCIQKVSIRGKSRDIFKRMNNCFESLFFRQLFQEAYSLGKSCFIVIHISGSFDKLKQSYKRSYLQNKQGGFFNCASQNWPDMTEERRKALQLMRPQFVSLTQFPSTTPGKFENEGFTLKTYQMFSVHTTPEEFKKATITGQFWFLFEENLVREINANVFPRFQMFSIHKKPAFSNSSGLKIAFKKAPFPWQISVNGRSNRINKAGFSNFSNSCKTWSLS